MAKLEKRAKENYRFQARIQKTGVMELRDKRRIPLDLKDMKQEANRLLKDGGWTNKRELDPRFSETDKAKKS